MPFREFFPARFGSLPWYFPAIRLPSPVTLEIVDFVALTLFSRKFVANEAVYSVARFLTTRFIQRDELTPAPNPAAIQIILLNILTP